MAYNSFADVVTKNQERLFIGREEECRLFRRYLEQPGKNPVILNIFDIGGIGKSSLLDQFEGIAIEAGAAFFKVDSIDFQHSPKGFLNVLAHALGVEADLISPVVTLNRCMKALSNAIQLRRVVLAIDTYEEMHALDRWLRETFISRLPGQVLLIISGRTPLTELWHPYPHWSSLVHPIPLSHLTFAEVQDYARLHNLEQPRIHQQLYALSQGLPLIMALLLEMRERDDAGKSLQGYLTAGHDQIVYHWLRETPSDQIRQIVEAAALVRRFDQDLLEHMIENTMAPRDFDQLVNLSFIRRTKSGWMVHHLLRTHIAREIRLRTPSRHRTLWQRSISYYHERLVQLPPGEDRSALMEDLFYVLGDSLLRMAFFQETSRDRFFAEAADESHYDEIKAFLDDLIERFNHLNVHVEYRDPVEAKDYLHQMPVEYFRREARMLAGEQLHSLDPEAFHLIRNEAGESVGLIVNVPINDKNMDYLGSSPVSRGYFNQLSPQELEEYAVPAPGRSGSFLRLIGFKDDDDIVARTALMYHLLSLWLQDPRSIVTTAFPFYIRLLEQLGFQKVPDLIHHHYGAEFPAPTFVLDLRDERLAQFLDHIISKAGVSVEPHLAGWAYDLTEREVDVTRLVLEGLSNVEIAQRLNLAEITIKKHLTSIYEKIGVKNRVELMAKIYSAL